MIRRKENPYKSIKMMLASVLFTLIVSVVSGLHDGGNLVSHYNSASASGHQLFDINTGHQLNAGAHPSIKCRVINATVPCNFNTVHNCESTQWKVQLLFESQTRLKRLFTEPLNEGQLIEQGESWLVAGDRQTHQPNGEYSLTALAGASCCVRQLKIVGSDLVQTGSCSLDFCGGRKCMNGGVCSAGRCSCKPGFSGESCEHKDTSLSGLSHSGQSTLRGNVNSDSPSHPLLNSATGGNSGSCPANFICCNDVSYFNPDNNLKCCGSQVYNERLQMCTVEKPAGTSPDVCPEGFVCCGKMMYLNPSRELECCGTKVYDKTKQSCSHGVLASKTEAAAVASSSHSSSAAASTGHLPVVSTNPSGNANEELAELLKAYFGLSASTTPKPTTTTSPVMGLEALRKLLANQQGGDSGTSAGGDQNILPLLYYMRLLGGDTAGIDLPTATATTTTTPAPALPDFSALFGPTAGGGANAGGAAAGGGANNNAALLAMMAQLTGGAGASAGAAPAPAPAPVMNPGVNAGANPNANNNLMAMMAAMQAGGSAGTGAGGTAGNSMGTFPNMMSGAGGNSAGANNNNMMNMFNMMNMMNAGGGGGGGMGGANMGGMMPGSGGMMPGGGGAGNNFRPSAPIDPPPTAGGQTGQMTKNCNGKQYSLTGPPELVAEFSCCGDSIYHSSKYQCVNGQLMGMNMAGGGGNFGGSFGGSFGGGARIGADIQQPIAVNNPNIPTRLSGPNGEPGPIRLDDSMSGRGGPQSFFEEQRAPYTNNNNNYAETLRISFNNNHNNAGYRAFTPPPPRSYNPPTRAFRRRKASARKPSTTSRPSFEVPRFTADGAKISEEKRREMEETHRYMSRVSELKQVACQSRRYWLKQRDLDKGARCCGKRIFRPYNNEKCFKNDQEHAGEAARNT